MSNGALPLIFSASRVKQVDHLTRQVFKVELNSGATVIVKGESSNAAADGRHRANVEFSYDAMRAVASGTKARAMDGIETRDWLALKDSSCIDAAGAAELKRIDADASLKKSYVWMIVSWKEGLFSLEDVTKRGDTSEMVTLAAAIRQEENIERLAGIMAVDLFTANMDRINYYRGTVRDGHGGQCFTNPGNVLFVRKGDGRILFKGLDTFHYNNHFAYLDNVVAKVKTVPEGGYIWPGEWLNSDRELERIALNVAQGFNHELLDVLVRAGFKASIIKSYSLRTKHRKALVTHMKKSRHELKQFSRLREAKAGGRGETTAGLKSRMKVMGWSK